MVSHAPISFKGRSVLTLHDYFSCLYGRPHMYCGDQLINAVAVWLHQVIHVSGMLGVLSRDVHVFFFSMFFSNVLCFLSAAPGKKCIWTSAFRWFCRNPVQTFVPQQINTDTPVSRDMIQNIWTLYKIPRHGKIVKRKLRWRLCCHNAELLSCQTYVNCFTNSPF